jgi:hypothetical protein
MRIQKFLLLSTTLCCALTGYAQTQVLLQGVLPGRALLSINGGHPLLFGSATAYRVSKC